MNKKSNIPNPLMPTYSRFDIAFDRGVGAYLFDAEGGKYLDFASGIAVTALGHSHPHLVETLKEQGEKLWHTSNLFQIPLQEKLAERLVAATFADNVFFTNSGVEAMECAIKLARKYHSSQGHPEKYRIISFKNAFHGRSLATIAASGKEKLTKGFGPMPDGFDQVPFIDLEALAAAITPETAAILLEPVQGEGGILPATGEDLQAIRNIADEHGLLLIFDEIQCGMGRAGKLFAHEWAGVTPDIMAVAKGIGGGFPVGACLARASVGESLTFGSHGTTYGGNPLAMALGNAVLDIMLEDGFFEHVQGVTKTLMAGLRSLQQKYPALITDVRGLGLMIGVECTVKTRPLIAKALELGLVLAPSGENIIRLLPPLIIDEGHITEALAKLDQLFSEIKT
ncbi:MAG: aspartate aminotransferase family protein [Alphaproteobacteria bacterium]|nr:MAG: aspartate aminotransferase family protein [Alphaproteobacteria bacterium]